MDTRTTPPEAEVPDLVDQELVVREARRRQRRRWLATGIVVVLVAAIAAAVVVLGAGRTSNPSRPRTAQPQKSKPVVPTAADVVPMRPVSMAIGPNGNLYIADDKRNQVLERLGNGTFRPVAGNGTAGFSGDGGPATKAQLDDPAGVTFAPDGTLYIADRGNGRIRTVSPTGIITTIAGSGHQGSWVADGTPALKANLQPTALAFGPHGTMYVSTDREVLELQADGAFVRVLGEDANGNAGVYGIGGPAVEASADGATGLAFDAAGNLYVFGFNTKDVLMVDPQGVVHLLGSLYPRGPSGLVTTPDGSVIAMGELGVVRLSPEGIETLVSFPPTYLGITGFSPNGIAVGSDGSLYLDTYFGNGFTDRSAIIKIPAYGSGSPSLLWRQS